MAYKIVRDPKNILICAIIGFTMYIIGAGAITIFLCDYGWLSCLGCILLGAIIGVFVYLTDVKVKFIKKKKKVKRSRK